MKRFSRSISLFFLITMLVLSLVGCATKAPKAEVTEVVQETAPQETQEVKEQAPAAPMAEEKKPEAAPAAPVTVTVKPLEYSFDIYGYKVAIEAYDGYAYVTYPDFVTDAELGAAAKAALAAYPQYLSGVTYQITAPGKVTVNFMKGLTKADADYAVGLLQSNLKWYIDKMFAAPAATTTVPAETTAPAAPVAPVAQALKYSFDVYGYKVAIEAYDGYAYVTYPDFVTDAELAAAAKAALAAYPQYLSGVTYQITAPGKVTVNFLKGLTVADAEYAVALLQSNLKWYVDQMFAQPAAPTTTATAVAETKPAETAAPAAEAAPVVEVVEVVEEITYPYGVTPIVKDASGATEFSLYIVHTNDVHARVTEGQDGSMGYAKLATLLKWGRSLTDDILLLDAGDVTHGTNFANLFKGQTVLNLLDMLGYDAVAPGNHDFNYGFDVLLQDAKTAEKYSNTRVLCANILDEDGYLMFQPYQIYDFNGFKVAVIGLSTPDTKTKAHPKYTEGLTFMSDLVVNNAQYALDLAHQYADYVVVLGHIGEDADGSSGITSDWICENLNGIDLFVDGHSHTDEPGKVVNGALIVQAGQYLKEVGVVEVHVKDNTVTGEYSLNITADDVTKPEESKIAKALGITAVPADAEVTAYIDSVNAQIDEVYSEVIATVPMKLDGERAHVRTKQTNLSKMICAAMTAETGADFTITNGGGIRASIAKGNVTVGDVNTVLPFTNTIAVVEITGAQVYEALEHGYSKYPETNGAFSQSDLQVVFNPRGAEGNRIVKVLLNGKAIAKDSTVYHCATNDFVAAGGDGYTMMGKVTQVGRMLNEVFLDYLKANYPVK